MFVTTADALPRIIACEGSRNMPAYPPADTVFYDDAGAPLPPPDTTARDEGTAAHYMALAAFNNACTLEELIDRKAPNGIYMSGDMAEHVAQYLSELDCGEMETDTSFGCDVWRVNGRADHIKWRPDTGVLTVDDLKYGWRLVEPQGHWSLIWHAIGYCVTRQIQPTRIDLRIHQPRPYHPDGILRTWSIDYATLMALYTELHTKLSSLGDILNTGPQCQGCHALAICPAAHAAALNAIDASERAVPNDIPDDALSYELDVKTTALATLTNQLEALREMASHRISTGRVIPNYGRDPQYANTRWKAGLDAATLSMATGKDLTKPAGFVTPAEAKRRGVPAAVVAAFTERPLIGAKLVRSSATTRANRLLGKRG
jgi:hypothetical protein